MINMLKKEFHQNLESIQRGQKKNVSFDFVKIK